MLSSNIQYININQLTENTYLLKIYLLKNIAKPLKIFYSNKKGYPYTNSLPLFILVLKNCN